MYSIEHKEFLLNIKRRKYIIRTIQVAILIGFIFFFGKYYLIKILSTHL